MIHFPVVFTLLVIFNLIVFYLYTAMVLEGGHLS